MQRPDELIEQAAPLPFPLAAREGTPRVAVVVPVFNEESVVERTYERLRTVLDGLEVPWSVLFVNDGSNDGTVGVLESLYAADDRVSYIVLSRNFGHQAALTAGLDHVDADVVITMDADLQHPPELIPLLLQAWRSGYDVVHTRKLGTDEQSHARSLTTRLAYTAIRRVAQVDIIPQASDFRLLDRDALTAVRRLPEQSRLYRGITPWVGFRQAVVPYWAAARLNGSSRYGLRQLMQLFSRSFFDFSNAPLQVGLIAGAATLVICALYVAFVTGAYLFGQPIPRGFVPLIFLVVFLGSVNLTFSGIIGVYLARIYNEVRARPGYIVGRVRDHAPARVPLRAVPDERGAGNGAHADLQPLPPARRR
jgi:dolichol-phosphate mannosyltransferase